MNIIFNGQEIKFTELTHGYTSTIFLYNTMILKKVNHFLQYGVYEREKFILNYLNKCNVSWCPKLIHYNDAEKYIIMSYCGCPIFDEKQLSNIDIKKKIYEQIKIIMFLEW